MGPRALAAALASVAALAGSGLRAAEEPADATIAAGKTLYANHCATCHGDEAAGDGRLREWLDVAPADLTVLGRDNDGEFPFDEVLAKIDGTRVVEGHRVSDMPVWAEVFKVQDRAATEEEIEAKLRSLTAYLSTLQQPSEAP